MGFQCHRWLMMPMHMKRECVCVKRLFGHVYVLVDLSYISKQLWEEGTLARCVPEDTRGQSGRK